MRRWTLIVTLVVVGLLSACAESTEDASPASTDSRESGSATVAVVSATEPRASAATEPRATATAEPTKALTNTPEPTATATLTPTPEPTNTPQPTSTPSPVPPTPTPTPPPAPKVYSGVGDNVIDVEKPEGPDSVAIAYIRGNAGSNYFGVESYDAAGNQVDLLVNTTDPYEGIVLIDVGDDDKTTRMQVAATGEWFIEIRPLATARRVSVPGTIEGAGDDVVIIEGQPDTAHIVGNAEGNYFGVIGYGDRYDLLVNTTDPYDGRVIVNAKTVLIQVTAVGSWSIAFE